MSRAQGTVVKPISVAPSSGPGIAANQVGEWTPSADHNRYFIPNPRKGAPLGPFSEGQILGALRAGRLGPRDRVWVTGLSSWLVVSDVFREFYQTPEGRLAWKDWHMRATSYARREFPGTVVDLVTQVVLLVPFVVVIWLHDGGLLNSLLPAVVVPFFYWLGSNLVFGGRSVGMTAFRYDYRSVHSKGHIGAVEFVARGILSFLLFLCLGLELLWLMRSKRLLSSEAMGLKSVFDQEVDAG
jgi:hypothetical protein